MAEQSPNSSADPSSVPEKTPSIDGTEMAVFKLALPNHDLSELPEDSPSNEIRSLDISSNRFSSFDFVSKCRNLIEIKASDNQLSEGFVRLSELTFLSNLNLSGNLFESLSGFPQSEILASLDLSKNHLKTVSDLPSLPLLRTLNLSHNSITDLQLPGLPSLQFLNLSGNLLVKLELPPLPSLRMLDGSHNSIEEIEVFEGNSLPFVSQCDLTHNSIGDAEVLKSLQQLPMLYHLMIAHNPLAVSDGSHIAPVLVILPTLTILDEKLLNAKDKVKANLPKKNAESVEGGDSRG
jgi:Leucine-rich repeat (LRR) protein